MKRIFYLTIIIICSTATGFSQGETINNQTVIEMSKAGLSTELILRKIASSQASFDLSSNRLIELKKAGVDDAVINSMLDRNEQSNSSTTGVANAASSESTGPAPASGAKVMSMAKTIAFGKSSLQPSRQALEKELMKRKDFRQLNLTIQRYKETADLFVDIGFVSGSWVTHRYVYRIYDRKTGSVITAGETTSWGSLAENLARHIAKGLVAARNGS
jgi:hypothetical protein